MASLLTSLGLRAPSLPNLITPNHAPAYLSLHFVLAYCVLAPRHLKQIHGIDHNVSPREDLTKYGDAAVRAGTITPKQLAMMKRNESAHANAIENYTFFVAAMGFATFAGVERELVNRAGLLYTVARVAYGFFYIFVDRLAWSLVRTVAWWVGNGSCFWLLYRAGKKLNLA
ncbi:hypothetical protein MMC34_001519 [Xylographa carneopallida]|nr:hypothetical protein [Xylographa carneopallida]